MSLKIFNSNRNIFYLKPIIAVIAFRCCKLSLKSLTMTMRNVVNMTMYNTLVLGHLRNPKHTEIKVLLK